MPGSHRGLGWVSAHHPGGMEVDNRGRALRDAHGKAKENILTLKGSHFSGDCLTLPGSGTFLRILRGRRATLAHGY
ncbi:MAG: hypothetical protein M3410_06400 [Acidobacteriota bacterium]|nr:hypothetical protein [Acidobacteriota bacterium]